MEATLGIAFRSASRSRFHLRRRTFPAPSPSSPNPLRCSNLTIGHNNGSRATVSTLSSSPLHPLHAGIIHRQRDAAVHRSRRISSLAIGDPTWTSTCAATSLLVPTCRVRVRVVNARVAQTYLHLNLSSVNQVHHEPSHLLVGPTRQFVFFFD